jgi:hypothetical protein
LLGKKKKRINKFKKAIYRYRLVKKKFIVENLLKANDNDKNIEEIIPEENKSKEVSVIEDYNNAAMGGIPIKEDNTKLSSNNLIQITKEDKPKESVGMVNAYNPLLQNPPNYNYQYNNYSYPTNQNYFNYLYQAPYYGNTNFNMNMQQQYNYQQMYNNTQQVPYLNYFNTPFYMPGQPMYFNTLQQQNNKFDLNNPKSFNLNPTYNKQNNKHKNKNKKQNMIVNTNQNLPISNKEENSTGFIFEKFGVGGKSNDEQNTEYTNFVKESYGLEKDLTKLEGIEFNNYLKEHKDIKKINIKNLQKISDGEFIQDYVNKYEGVLPGSNYKKKFIREYVDQILSTDLDKKFSDFIIRMREIYFKKVQQNPLKAKKRYIVGLREIEKFLRLE